MAKVSIVTPTYNRAHLIEQLVKTVFAQTFHDFNWIIVDDGSTDNTKDVVESFKGDHPDQIQYVYQDNQGSGAARNTGIKHTDAPIVAFLDSDDEWQPQYLEKMVSVLDSGEYQWAVASAKRIDIDSQGNAIHEHIIKSNLKREQDFFTKELSLFEALLTGNVVGETSRVVVKKVCLLEAGLFNEELLLSQDFELWLRLAQKGYKLYILDEPLVIYHKSIDSITKTRFHEALQNGYRIISRYSKEAFKLNPEFRQFYGQKLWNYARDILKQPNKDYILFMKCIIKSLWFDMSLKRIFSSVKPKSSG